MLTVHHLGISQSDRIVWLCEELGLPYELIRYDRDPVTKMAPPAYKALHPSGTAPVITDGDVVLAESAAIIDYIVAKFGDNRLTLSAHDPEFAHFVYWYHFANGSLMPAIMGMASPGPIADVMKARTDCALAMLDAHLADRIWLAGDSFTVADIMIAFPLTTMREFMPYDLSPYPNILAYLARLGARPAFKSAIAKADPGLEIKLN
ncbi:MULTISPECIES: glutathione S-transferase family protein [Sphingobium]|uniref:glutathione S-transferase family protein n=1 Tax=Sphingobium TaxID=165695 RepID=UPI00159C9B34|nr:glutathione S-transferase family protein [Sphingobium sp. 15-1]